MKYKTLLVITIYVSQNGDLKKIIESIQYIVGLNPNVIVIGDFNFHEDTESCHVLYRFVMGQGSNQLISEPTHIEGKCEFITLFDVEVEFVFYSVLHISRLIVFYILL